jgi:hypothetical protein
MTRIEIPDPLFKVEFDWLACGRDDAAGTYFNVLNVVCGETTVRTYRFHNSWSNRDAVLSHGGEDFVYSIYEDEEALLAEAADRFGEDLARLFTKLD